MSFKNWEVRLKWEVAWTDLALFRCDAFWFFPWMQMNGSCCKTKCESPQTAGLLDVCFCSWQHVPFLERPDIAHCCPSGKKRAFVKPVSLHFSHMWLFVSVVFSWTRVFGVLRLSEVLNYFVLRGDWSVGLSKLSTRWLCFKPKARVEKIMHEFF